MSLDFPRPLDVSSHHDAEECLSIQNLETQTPLITKISMRVCSIFHKIYAVFTSKTSTTVPAKGMERLLGPNPKKNSAINFIKSYVRAVKEFGSDAILKISSKVLKNDNVESGVHKTIANIGKTDPRPHKTQAATQQVNPQTRLHQSDTEENNRGDVDRSTREKATQTIQDLNPPSINQTDAAEPDTRIAIREENIQMMTNINTQFNTSSHSTRFELPQSMMMEAEFAKKLLGGDATIIEKFYLSNAIKEPIKSVDPQNERFQKFKDTYNEIHDGFRAPMEDLDNLERVLQFVQENLEEITQQGPGRMLWFIAAIGEKTVSSKSKHLYKPYVEKIEKLHTVFVEKMELLRTQTAHKDMYIQILNGLGKTDKRLRHKILGIAINLRVLNPEYGDLVTSLVKVYNNGCFVSDGTAFS